MRSFTSFGSFPFIELRENNFILSLASAPQDPKVLELEDEDVGKLTLSMESNSKLWELVVPDFEDRICWERSGLYHTIFHSISHHRSQIRYSSQKDMLYLSFCPTNRHEYSLEVESFNDQIIFDFDIDDKIIGFCILSITSNCMNPECLKILPDHKWVQMSDFIEGNYGDETLTNNNNNSQINNENNSSSSSLSSSDQSTTNLVPEINNLKISRDDHIKSRQNSPSLKKSGHESQKEKGVSLIPNERNIQSKAPGGLFVQPVVRDLYWVIKNPPMITQEKNTDLGLDLVDIDSYMVGKEDDLKNWFLKLDENPKPFYEWADQKKSRSNILGGYFLLLIQFWLEDFLKLEKVFTKFQLFNGPKTVGDMDLLFLDTNTGKWNHWELGIKFYLVVDGDDIVARQSNDFDALCNMVGPYGGGETLFSYIKKTQRQLQVKDIECVSTYLKSENIYPDDSSFLIKGFLFIPLTEEWYINKQPFKSINKFLHPSQIYGWWVRFPDYDQESKREKSNLLKQEEEENSQLNNRRRRKYIIHHNWNKYSDNNIKKESEIQQKDSKEELQPPNETTPIKEDQQQKEELIPNEEVLIEKGEECEDVLLLYTPQHREEKEKKISFSKYMILAKGNYFSKVFLTEEELANTSLYSYSEVHEKIKELFLDSNKAILIAELVSYKDLKEIDMLSQFGFDSPDAYESHDHSILYYEISRGWVVRNDWKSNVNL